MADNSVFITGTASGAFTEAFSDLPAWASEKTAMQLEKHLRNSLNIQTKIFEQLRRSVSGTTGKMSAEESKKFNSELDKAARSLKRNNEEDEKALKRKKDLGKLEEDRLKNGKQDAESSGFLKTVASNMLALGTAVLNVNKDYIDTYDALYKSGINVLNGNNSTADGFTALNQVVNLTGMRLQTLQKIAERYAQTINATGFTKFAKAISISSSALNELGFSNESAAELIGTMIEAESGFMDIRRKSAAQISQDAVRFGRELDRLSKTVGMSREQLQENIKQESKTAEASLLYATRGEQATKNLLAATAGLAPDLRKSLIEMAAVSSPAAQSELYQKLAAAGMGDVAEQLNSILQRSMAGGPEEFNAAMESFSKGLRESGRISQLAAIWDGTGKAGGDLITSIMQYGGIISEATEGQKSNAQKTQESVAKLQTELESLAATMQKIFSPLTEQVNFAADALKGLNSVTQALTETISAEIRSWIGLGAVVTGFGLALLAGTAAVAAFLSRLGPAGTVLTELIRLTGQLFTGAKAVVTGFFSWLGSSGKSMATYVFSGISKTFTAIMGGIKSMISGIISSMTSAFSFISNVLKTKGAELGSSVGGKAKGVAGVAAVVGLALAGGYAADAVAGAAGVGGNTVDEVQDDKNWQMMSTMEKMQSGLARGIEGLGKLFFLDNVANEAAAERIKNETEYLKERGKPTTPVAVTPMKSVSEVAAPTSPPMSFIDGAGETPAYAKPEEKPNVPSAERTSTLSAPGIDKPGKGADINTLLSHQSLLLEQILIGTNSLVSVNKDILRYARNTA